MAEPVITEPVTRVLENVQSVFELEVLLLLRELPDQEWTPQTLGRMVDAEPDRARSALMNLSRAGLVERHYGGESLCFRFGSTQPTARTVDQLAALYIEHRAMIVSIIEAHASSALRRFSDAFRFRKEP